MPALNKQVRCPRKGCKFKGGSLYLKQFYRPTANGVKIHHYWVISHGEVVKGELQTTIHYIGKRPKGKLGELAHEIETKKLEKIEISGGK